MTPASCPLLVSPLEHAVLDQKHRYSFDLSLAGNRFPVYCDVRIPPELKRIRDRPPSDDARLLASLIPAMRTGASVDGIATISSQRTLEHFRAGAKLLASWFPELEEPDLSRLEASVAAGNTESEPSRPPGPTGAFFSGGVDSLYTALQNHADIDALIFVRGFDVLVEDVEGWRRIEHRIERLARILERPIVRVETNIRSFSDRVIDWPTYHGTAMASVAELLSPWLDRFLIASSCDNDHLFPYGSHPDLDHLWSSDQRTIVHHGCEATRLAKVRKIAGNKNILRLLRVCWREPSDYNCSKCRKCALTMMALDIAGALPDAASFKKADLVELAKEADFVDRAASVYFNELIDAYSVDRPDSRILHELRRSRRRGTIGRALRRTKTHLKKATRSLRRGRPHSPCALP